MSQRTSSAAKSKVNRPAPSLDAGKTRQRQSRPPLLRMMRLHDLLMNGCYPNCRTLVVEMGVSEKTFLRDIAFMRDQMGCPIEYDATRHGYYYTEPVTHFPGMEISQGEVVALLIAEKALAQHRGTVFEKPLRAACEKIAQSLQGKITVQWAELIEAVSFHQGGASRMDVEIFAAISHAVKESFELEFRYHKLHGTEPEARRVRPYHLGCIENQWYCIAYDLDRGALRNFALPRIREPRATSTRFLRPADFSVKEYLGDSFGIFRRADDEPAQQVRIRFDAFATRLVAERTWHESQEIEPRPRGECELRLKLRSLEEVERWILSWGGHARVIAPKSLKTRILAAAQAIIAATEG